jgi:hypothetical protein
MNILIWNPIKHYTKLKNTDNVPGIYIWGFMDDEQEFLPYYVGKAWNIGDRLCSHLSNIKGGSYTIYTKHDMFKLDEDVWVYKPNTIEQRISFVLNTNQNNVQYHADEMIKGFYFTYAKMEEKDFELFGFDAEKTILNLFKKSDVLINTRFGIAKTTIAISNLLFRKNRLKIL